MKRIKPTKALLSERLRIHNPWGFCEQGGGRVYVNTQSATTGRAAMSARVQVIGLREKTNPSGWWGDCGHKTWNVSRDTKAARIEQAKAWASERYGITEWVRDPFGGWQDARVWG